MFVSFADGFLLVSVGLVAAFLAAQFITSPDRSPRRPRPDLDAEAVMLFDGEDLMTHSSAAEHIVRTAGDAATWGSVRRTLAKAFSNLPKNPEEEGKDGILRIAGRGAYSGRDAVVEWIDGITRLTISPEGQRHASNPTLSQRVEESALSSAPYPIWREDDTGHILWCNAAYKRLQRTTRRDSDHDSNLFPQSSSSDPATSQLSRVSVTDPVCDKTLWFDVTRTRDGDTRIGYAVDVNAIVDAELAQRNFVQTLAKTFAQLSIGLAIFDRKQQLVLFNPALIDLTDLPADFLSARPTLLNFFDRLRDQRVMPEPKDYTSWRNEMTELVEAANNGRYHETWSLPSGSVYSVIGRPHPDGAVAFLFEDITAEITLTRRFRAELELGQAVMDQLEQAIAVFSADGTLAYSNARFHCLWGLDPDRGFAQTTFSDVKKVWMEKVPDSPFWEELTNYFRNRWDAHPCETVIQMPDGPNLQCRVTPIQSGATLVSFFKTETRQTDREQGVHHLPV